MPDAWPHSQQRQGVYLSISFDIWGLVIKKLIALSFIMCNISDLKQVATYIRIMYIKTSISVNDKRSFTKY